MQGQHIRNEMLGVLPGMEDIQLLDHASATFAFDPVFPDMMHPGAG